MHLNATRALAEQQSRTIHELEQRLEFERQKIIALKTLLKTKAMQRRL